MKFILNLVHMTIGKVNAGFDVLKTHGLKMQRKNVFFFEEK